MIGTCRLIKKSDGETGQIKYAHSSAVTVWTPIFVSGLGALIPIVTATAAEMADAAIIFYRKGIFNFAIQAAETVAAKVAVYYDTATDKVTTTSSATTYFIGVSVAAGSGTAGYVDVELMPYPFSMGSVSKEHLDSGIKPKYIDVAVGKITVNGLTTVESLSGITDAAGVAVLATDSGFAQVTKAGANIDAVVNSIAMSAGKIALTLNTPTGAGAEISYCIKRPTA
jgi:hypothetical protein